MTPRTGGTRPSPLVVVEFSAPERITMPCCSTSSSTRPRITHPPTTALPTPPLTPLNNPPLSPINTLAVPQHTRRHDLPIHPSRARPISTVPPAGCPTTTIDPISPSPSPSSPPGLRARTSLRRRRGVQGIFAGAHRHSTFRLSRSTSSNDCSVPPPQRSWTCSGSQDRSPAPRRARTTPGLRHVYAVCSFARCPGVSRYLSTACSPASRAPRRRDPRRTGHADGGLWAPAMAGPPRMGSRLPWPSTGNRETTGVRVLLFRILTVASASPSWTSLACVSTTTTTSGSPRSHAAGPTAHRSRCRSCWWCPGRRKEKKGSGGGGGHVESGTTDGGRWSR
ncbi:hypothetical protein F4780DRAFT_246789 [Xylariomycetidae sp. FL0641]|nr:hypothetical protein F4780DRAFT_246789 [Xylariomycetidae sp. FL0641]